MRLNVDDLQMKLKNAQEQLKKITDPNSTEAIALRLDIGQYKNQITEAKRQLNNLLNTGEPTLSRLQTKFNQVTGEIQKSREELMKLGKSTASMDDLLKKANEVDSKFKT